MFEFMVAGIVTFSIYSSRATQYHHRDEKTVTASSLESALTNCDTRNPSRIRSYENCRVSLSLSSLFLLFAKRVIRNSFPLKRLRTLSKNSRGVPQLFPFRNSFPHESGNWLSSTPSDKIASLPIPCRRMDRAPDASL